MSWSEPLVVAAPSVAVALLLYVAGRNRFRRRGLLIMLCAVVAVLSPTLLTYKGSELSGPVVMVVDGEEAFSKLGMGLDAAARRYGAAGMSGCDVVLIQGARLPDGTCPTAGDLERREWFSASRCAGFKPSEALTAPDPDCALRLAHERFVSAGWLGSLAAALRLSTRRVAVLVTQPRKWSQTWTIDPAALSAKLYGAGVTIDLVRAGDEVLSEETPTLTLHVDPPRFPERQVEGAITLQLGSRALAGLQGSTLKAATECELDMQEGSGFRVSIPQDPYVVQTSGAALRAEPLLLGDFRGVHPGDSPYTLVRGFHLLRCKVTLTLADGRQIIPVTAARYIDVGPRYFMVVAGQAGAYAADGITPVRQVDLHALWSSTGPRPWKGDLAFGGVVPEATFRASGLTKGAAPSVLILHDLADATWAARCADLEGLVSSGTTLLVSGPPLRDRAPGCGFLPAFAKPATNAPVLVDRRPRVSFLLDPSRLGALHHRPQSGTTAAVPHLPMPARDYAHATLADGLELQRRVVERACAALRALDSGATCAELEPRENPRRRYIEARTLPTAPFQAAVTEAASEAQLASVSQLSTRLAPLLADPPPQGVVRSNEVVVLFSYDLAQLAAAASSLEQLQLRGVRILVVRLDTPYTEAVAPLLGSDSLASTLADSRNRAADALRGSEPAAALYDRRSLGQRLVDGRWEVNLAVDDAYDDAGRAGDALGGELSQLLKPNASMVVVRRRGRFVDERWGPLLPEAAVARWYAPPADAWAAPLQFRALEPSTDADTAIWLSVMAAPGVAGGAHLAVPLAYSGVHGRGEVLVLGYSIFEGLTGTYFPDSPWRNDANSRIAPTTAGMPDAWGPTRVADAVKYQASIEPGPGESPRIVGASVADPSGRIEIQVAQRLRSGGDVDWLELSRCREGGFSGACMASTGAEAVSGRVVGLDGATQQLTYSFLPSDLVRVCGGVRGCIATLRRSSTDAPPDETRLFVNGSPSSAAGAIADLQVLEALRALALYSGGADIKAGGRPVQSRPPVRSLTILALLAFTLAYWGLRLLQRWRTGRGLGPAPLRTGATPRIIDARGAVHSAGDALGRPQTTTRVGAFAGFRPLEAGDKLASAVREDVVLYLAAGGRAARIPRVVRRIDELGRHVRIVVNVGMSMRVPMTHKGDPSKLITAAQTCELIAEVGWQFRSHIEVIPTGLHGMGETLGPSGSPGARGAVAAHLLAQGRRPASWTSPLSLPEVDQPTSVVLVSDFLNEDLHALRRYAADVEEQGGLFGAIHIHTKEELLLLGAGVAPASGVFCDRTTWTSLDVRMAQEEFRNELEVALGHFTGGLLSVSGSSPPSEVVSSLVEAPLLAVLR